MGSTAIQPNIGALQGSLSAIFNTGTQQGRKASVFAVAGDDSAADPNFLQPFASANGYALDDKSQTLKTIIDWYSQTDLGGTNSFNHRGGAAQPGWTAANLIAPASGGDCQSGESVLACEIRDTNAAVVIISVGLNDAINATDVNTFSANLKQAIEIAKASGAIPVLLTAQPRLDANGSDITIPYNQAIIQTAASEQVPVVNVWRALNDLNNHGLNSDGTTLSVSPNGAGDLTAAASAYGVNLRNAHVLAALDSLRAAIFPNAQP